MKQYVIDQLREEDYSKILEFLKENAESAVFDDIFWMQLPEELYSPIQKEHTGCHPFCFAVNLSMSRVDFELLIRTRRILRCNCIAYADHRQREYILDFVDKMLEELQIKV
ncbi:MAG: hypothetical protein LLG06_03805 [Desulfobacteraceae bacterium]|nr:hypothetical protein [Desulfobacteraceae bacterium]